MLKKKPATPRNETYLPVRVSMLGGFRLQAGGCEVDEASTVHGSCGTFWNISLRSAIGISLRTSWFARFGMTMRSEILQAL